MTKTLEEMEVINKAKYYEGLCTAHIQLIDRLLSECHEEDVNRIMFLYEIRERLTDLGDI